MATPSFPSALATLLLLLAVAASAFLRAGEGRVTPARGLGSSYAALVVTASPISSPSSSPAAGGSYDFWKKNLSLFPKAISALGSLLELFGSRAGSVYGSKMTVMDALQTSKVDGYSQLAKQGIAAYLNALSIAGFSYTVKEVREDFVNALGSQDLALLQAGLFEQANFGA